MGRKKKHNNRERRSDHRSESWANRSMSQTMSAIRTTASIIIERPPLNSKPIGRVLLITMYGGLMGAALAIASGIGMAVAKVILWLHADMAVAMHEDVITWAGLSLPWLFDILRWSMVLSTLYGFASFLWYKMEAGRVIGQWLATILFLIIPVALLAIKFFDIHDWFEAETAIQIGDGIETVAEYYSLFWYAVIFMIAAFSWRRDARTGEGARALPRWAVLGVLCYIPYGYVLFVGEDVFFREYIMDTQLALYALVPTSLMKH